METTVLWQPAIPDRYTTMTDGQLVDAITARKKELGKDVVVLGHHYQQDDIIRFADFTGDSFKLSQLAAERVKETGAKYVVFCGVHFMAESADILAPQGVQVILPDLGAGCSMADMADFDQARDAWDQIHQTLDQSGFKGRVIPICYMNCSAAIKAFCGERGGAVCTSSNCARVFEWALAGGTEPRRDDEEIKILFLPDQHLGRNTAASMGYDIHSDMCLWDPKDTGTLGGCDEDAITRSTFVLWKGHCSVHKLFRPEHVDQVRADWPDVTVIVHPECAYEVVQKADIAGSTEGIIQHLHRARSGSRWAIGTEVHLVNRLCREAATRGVEARILSSCQCLCTTMYRIDPPHLLWVLDNLAQGKVVNRIEVHPQVKRWSLVAMNRMLSLAAQPAVETPREEPAV
ncbi:MAG: quinolinate synthase NadA [Phycisphaera sp.]|nr:quinolinate synthase NadA [Phycisphaera sp.]